MISDKITTKELLELRKELQKTHFGICSICSNKAILLKRVNIEEDKAYCWDCIRSGKIESDYGFC